MRRIFKYLLDLDWTREENWDAVLDRKSLFANRALKVRVILSEFTVIQRAAELIEHGVRLVRISELQLHDIEMNWQGVQKEFEVIRGFWSIFDKDGEDLVEFRVGESLVLR